MTTTPSYLEYHLQTLGTENPGDLGSHLYDIGFALQHPNMSRELSTLALNPGNLGKHLQELGRVTPGALGNILYEIGYTMKYPRNERKSHDLTA